MILKNAYKMKPPVSARINHGHPLADKMIACYLLNEGRNYNAFDATGRGHTARKQAGVTQTMGRYGDALDLNGTNGHITIEDHADFTPASHPFSISIDVYMRGLANFYMAAKGEVNVNGEWWIRSHTDRKIYLMMFDEDVNACYIGRYYDMSLVAYENTWINIVGTYDGGKTSAGLKININGVRVDNADYQGNYASFVTVRNKAGKVFLGRKTIFYADGMLGSVMFWRRVLTQSDINRLYVDPFCMFEKRRKVLLSML